MYPSFAISPAYRYQFVATLSATISIISEGMLYGWSSPMIPLLKSTSLQMESSDETWLEVLYLLFGLFGIPVFPFLIKKLGPRDTILLSGVGGILAWVLLGFTSNLRCLYVGRCVGGLISNLNIVVVPMYVSEIADKKDRGFLTSFVSGMMFVGVLLVYSVVPFCPLYTISVVAIILLVVQLMVFPFMPDSPYYLIRKENRMKALESLRKLRGSESSDLEMDEIALEVRNIGTNSLVKEAFFKKSTLKAILLVALMIAAQNFIGGSAILMSLDTVLTKADSIYLSSNVASILFAVCMLVSVVFILPMIDTFGRRALLMLSSTLTGLVLLGLAVYFHLQSFGVDVKFISWLPVALVMCYVLTYNMGIEVVPNVMVTEIFSSEIKTIAMSFTDGMDIIFGTLSLFFFNYVTEKCSMYLPFYTFAGVAFALLLLTVFVVPETKGKSFQDIQNMLEK